MTQLLVRRSSYVVIPARLASTRLPRKLLLSETGKTLLQHTYEAACQARRPLGVCIAADHEEIAAAARSFGARVIMTSPTCASGTDRLAEVAPQLPEAELIVNVQGDEPELQGKSIDDAIELLERFPAAPMATLCTPIHEEEKLRDPSCVKVVFRDLPATAMVVNTGKDGRQAITAAPNLLSKQAVYFSRAAIPHAREWSSDLLRARPPVFYQHLGLYVYQRQFLPQFAAMRRTPLEQLENLEQLRVLENGYQIVLGIVDEPTIGIDTPEDYRAFVERFNRQKR